MTRIEKHHLPLLLLLTLVITSSFYYLSNGGWNDFGQTKPEWMLLIDGLLFLPLVCFYCINDKKQAAFKAIIYASMMVLLGSYLIPEANKHLWHYLESGRFVIITLFVIFELVTILTVFFAIKATLNKTIDPDLAISRPIESFIGQGKLANLMAFEARTWVYTIFHHRIDVLHFEGQHHFYGHLKDGTQSNLSGFIFIILFEIPLVHLLLHFIWSPTAALVFTALTAFSLLFLIAEYRAISLRPISIDTLNQQLIIRYGLFAPLTIPFADIESVSTHQGQVSRAKNIKRYNLFGTPNMVINTNKGMKIYLGLNHAEPFVESLKKHINCSIPV